ncbi:hypothetical protein ACGTJS_10545 [Faucicola mancuniensis]|uniref:hypothetical protein n=1 Tax=Faucicola mancuniensis TaxID=1309795 RepID=UPI0039773586
MSSGFVAGTLVHTDKGLMPIQNLKVGDLVLSLFELEFPTGYFVGEKGILVSDSTIQGTTE